MDTIDVLLIEDNEGDARLFQEELSEVGEIRYAIDREATLEEGLARLGEDGYDVILLDLSLPDSRGLDTVVRTTETAPRVPIVVLTGREDEKLALQTLQEGAQDYVVKGKYRGILHRVIQYAIERHRAQAELAALRERIAHTERMTTLATLVSEVAYELREATTAVSSTLHRIRRAALEAAEGERSPESLGEDVETAVAEAMQGMGRVDDLTQDLRRYYRAGEGRRERVSLDGVVADAIRLFQAAEPAGVDIHADLAETPEIALQPVQIQQVVIHLLRNATEAGGEGVRIRVRTGVDDGDATIAVEDDGPGIPEEVRDRLFEPFVTTKEGSDGLGLAVASRIVDAHDGEIGVDTGRDEGTTVTIRLPPRPPDEEG